LGLDEDRGFDEHLLASAGREARGHQNDALVRGDAPAKANVRHTPPAHPFRLKLGEIHAGSHDPEAPGRHGKGGFRAAARFLRNPALLL
jgi:hypothetical protein